MKEFFIRLSYKLTGFKSLFTAAVLAILVLHDLSPENADVLTVLIITVLGAKVAQYGKEVVQAMRKEKPDVDAEV